MDSPKNNKKKYDLSNDFKVEMKYNTITVHNKRRF